VAEIPKAEGGARAFLTDRRFETCATDARALVSGEVRAVAILKVSRFWSSPALARAAAPADVLAVPAAADGLDSFRSENDDPEPAAPAAAAPKTAKQPLQIAWLLPVAMWTLVVAISAGLGATGLLGYQRRFVSRATNGTVTLVTDPAGLDVTLAGRSLGKTPLTTTLLPGSYEVQLGSAATARKITLNVAAGSSIVHQVDFVAGPEQVLAGTGGLRIQTEPGHLPVSVDGVAHGFSPVSVDGIQPGNHEITVRTAAGFVKRTASVQSHETASMFIVATAAPSADAGAVSAGWVTVSSPVALDLREAGKLIGTSEASRLLLPAGDHDIEFENKLLGFTARRSIRVGPGKTTPISIDLPNGVVSINALPWAEVWIDGERVGETPIGNLSRQIGTHEVLFRHPQLGERRETVIIGAGKPARIGVDLRKK